MTEYIDRNKLIAEYDRVHVGEPGGARKLMVEAPAVDVVEVVRCKDCRFRSENDGLFKCFRGIYSFSGYKAVNPDDFCSYGERKKT